MAFGEFVIVTGYRQQQIVNFLEAHYPALEVTFIYKENMLLPIISTLYGLHGLM